MKKVGNDRYHLDFSVTLITKIIYYYKTNTSSPFLCIKKKLNEKMILFYSGALLTLLEKSWLNMNLIKHALSYYSLKNKNMPLSTCFSSLRFFENIFFESQLSFTKYNFDFNNFTFTS